MTFMKRAACVAAVLSLCLMTACADAEEKNSDESKASVQSDTVSAAEKENIADESAADEKTDNKSDNIGENLKKTAEIFEGDYTYSVKTVYSDSEDEITASTLVRRGDDVYMHNTESKAEGLDSDLTTLYISGECYEADNNVGAYSKVRLSEEIDADKLSVIKNVTDNNLEQTSTHIPADTEGMTVEEYTYTGDTFMTIYDFYFDEEGNLKMYTTLYSVEGEEDIVQTTEVLSLEAAADESLFSLDSFGGYTNFDELTKEEKQSFCQDVCEKYSVSLDDSTGITAESLSEISFDTFSYFIQSRGVKPEDKPEKEKAEGKDKDKDKETESEDDTASESESEAETESESESEAEQETVTEGED